MGSLCHTTLGGSNTLMSRCHRLLLACLLTAPGALAAPVEDVSDELPPPEPVASPETVTSPETAASPEIAATATAEAVAALATTAAEATGFPGIVPAPQGRAPIVIGMEDWSFWTWLTSDEKFVLALLGSALVLLFAILLHLRARRLAAEEMETLRAAVSDELIQSDERAKSAWNLRAKELGDRLSAEMKALRGQIESQVSAIRQESESAIARMREQAKQERDLLAAHVDETTQALSTEITAAEKRAKQEIGLASERQSAHVDETKRTLVHHIDETRRTLTDTLSAAEQRLLTQMEHERALIAAQFSEHRRERDDRRNQRRLEAIVERCEDESLAARARAAAEEGLDELALLVLAGIRELRNDIECFHATDRIIQRGGLAKTDRALLRRIMRVGMHAFFDALPFQGAAGDRPQPELTRQSVEETLAALEARMARGRDPLDWFGGGQNLLAEPEPAAGETPRESET